MLKKRSKSLVLFNIALASSLFISASNSGSSSQPRVVAYIKQGSTSPLAAFAPPPSSSSNTAASTPPSASSSSSFYNPSGTTGPSGSPTNVPKQQQQQQQGQPPKPTINAPVERPQYTPPKPKVVPGPTFIEPGIVFIKDEQYQGSDYLGRLPKQLPITAEIVKSAKETLPLTEQQLMDFIKKPFADQRFPLTEPHMQPELPFLRILVLLQPIDDRGVAAALRLSLFEAVKIDRVILQEGTFQAITWERESLVIAPKESAMEYIQKGCEALANDFLDRYKLFNENLPKKQEIEQMRGD